MVRKSNPKAFLGSKDTLEQHDPGNCIAAFGPSPAQTCLESKILENFEKRWNRLLYENTLPVLLMVLLLVLLLVFVFPIVTTIGVAHGSSKESRYFYSTSQYINVHSSPPKINSIIISAFSSKKNMPVLNTDHLHITNY